MATKKVSRAAVVGASAAPPAGVLITWGAVEMERRTGLPVEVCAALISSVAAPLFGFITHWASKLMR